VLWRLGHLTVASALASSAIAGAVVISAGLVRLRHRNGFGRPDLAVLRQGAHYGVRVQAGLLGALVNGRLDVMIMPAILASQEIGLYAVATSVSSIIVSLIDYLSLVVFSAASTLSDAARGRLIERALRVLLLATLAFAVPLFVLAPWALTLVYGRAFEPASVALRILIPGVLFSALSGVVESGLQAADRPGRASVAQVTGMVVTVVGLAALLRPLGINGAAITSAVSYFTTFAVAAWFLARTCEVNVLTSVRPDLVLAEIPAVWRWGREAARRRHSGGER
jgi:O-antigen/teichoic acid export membrane protein